MLTVVDDVPAPAPQRFDAAALDRMRRAAVWGDRVRLERKLRDWTQSQLAAAAGVSQAHVSRIERGSRSVSRDTLEAVAGAFVVPTAEVFPYADALPTSAAS